VASGQTTASLTGTVLDNTGAVIPNPQVILTDENSYDRRELITNGSGFFNFAGIKSETYTVDITASGFQKLEPTGISVNPGDTRNFSALTLTVGSSNEQGDGTGRYRRDSSGRLRRALSFAHGQRYPAFDHSKPQHLRVAQDTCRTSFTNSSRNQRDGPPSAQLDRSTPSSLQALRSLSRYPAERNATSPLRPASSNRFFV
jgi:hypothetical protein